MITVDKNLEKTVERLYEAYLSVYQQEKTNEILLKYCGEFSVTLIRCFADGIEEKMVHRGEKRPVIRRMFSSLIEGMQNIYTHGAMEETGQQKAFLFILYAQDHYKLLFGNIVSKEDKSFLKSYIGNINSYSDAELKQLHLESLKSNFIKKEGRAGLGIVNMRSKSSTPLEYQFFELMNQQSFLVIEVQISITQNLKGYEHTYYSN